MVLANLRATPTGSWTRSEVYEHLDPSEKTSVSYFLGMVQAELTTTMALGYTHLVHVDALLRAAGMPLRNSRPDFVAVSIPPTGPITMSGTVEAKGRTHRFDQTALTNAKVQARLTPMLAGLTPTYAIASEAYFNAADAWSSVLEDPDWNGDHVDVDVEDYLFTYYEHLVVAGRESGSWALRTDGNYSYLLSGYPLEVEVNRRIVEAVDARLSGSSPGNPTMLGVCQELRAAITDSRHVGLKLNPAQGSSTEEIEALFAGE